jgi:hypothetical protein
MVTPLWTLCELLPWEVVKVAILYERSSCHKIPELDQMYGLS